MFDVRWLMEQVDLHELYQLLHEYVEREDAAMLGSGDVESIYSSRYATHPLFEHLTSLRIEHFRLTDRKEVEDARVISYVLTHARRLRKLKLWVGYLKIDDAFTRHLIGAQLEKLEINISSGITDITIDVLCQQLAASLCSLTLSRCTRVSRTG